MRVGDNLPDWLKKKREIENQLREASVMVDNKLEGEATNDASGMRTPSGDATDLAVIEGLETVPFMQGEQPTLIEGNEDLSAFIGPIWKPKENTEDNMPLQQPNNEGEQIEQDTILSEEDQMMEQGEATQEDGNSAEGKTEQNMAWELSESLRLHLQGKDSEIPEEYREQLNEILNDPYVRILFGELDDEKYDELLTRNSLSYYINTRNMNRLGSTITMAYEAIMSDDYPEELRYISLMSVADTLHNASQRINDPDFVVEKGQNPIEAYLDEAGREGIEQIYTSRDQLIQDKLDFQAQVDAANEQRLADARAAVASGTDTPEQLAYVQENTNVEWKDVLADEKRGELRFQLNRNYFEPEYGGFYQTSIYKNLAVNGVTDTGSYQSEIKRVMEVLIDEDTETALSVDMTLDEYYNVIGGMTLDQLAQRAHARLQKQGESVTQEDAEAVEQVYGAGAGVIDMTVKGTSRGWNAFLLNNKDGIYKGLTIATIEETSEFLKGYYQELGPYGRAFYRDDLNALIDSGALSDEMANELREAMDKAPDIYEVGVDPRRFGGLLTDMKERRERISELDTYMLENGTEGENRWYLRISGAVEGGLQAGASGLIEIATGSKVVGVLLGEGINYYGSSVDRWLGKGYSLKSAGALAATDTVQMIAANQVQTKNPIAKMTGAGSLEQGKMLDVMAKNPSGFIRATGAVLKYTKNLAGYVASEAGVDEFKQNLAEKNTEEVFAPIYQKLDAGEDVKASDVIAALLRVADPQNAIEAGKETAENFREEAIISGMLMLAGTAGRNTLKYASVNLANEILAGNSEDVAGFLEAFETDIKNSEYQRDINQAAEQSMIDEATVGILARDKDADGTMAQIKVLETEAEQERTMLQESLEAWDAACDEQETIIADIEAGNLDGAAKRMEVCVNEINQYSEAAAEHERLAEEKETQARELRQKKLDEARGLAVMEVASETENVRASLMNPENVKETESEETDGKSLSINTEETNHVKVEKGTSNDIIEKDIHIPKSLGAKSVNHEIRLPNDETTTLTEGTWITKVTTIAGKGKERQIDEIEELIANYGGTAEKWEKKKGFGFVDYEGESYRAELHWYEEPTAGRWKFKVKPDADGNWFYDED